MNVAVNTRFLLPGKMEGFGVYTHEIMRRMVRDHPSDAFDFYFDRPFSETYAYADNVRLHRCGPPARHPFLYYIWYQHRLRSQLIRHRPDVFFSPDAYMPLNMPVPTVLTVHDVAPMRFPQHIEGWQKRYYQYFVPRFAAEARHIITVSEFSKHEIIRYLKVAEDKVSVVYNGVGEQYLEAAARPEAGNRDGRDKPYFLYVGAIHPRKNVPTLLHAFDLFRAQSAEDTELVIAGRSTWKSAAVEAVLAQMRFRSAVQMRGYVPAEDLPSLMRGAMGLVYVSLYEGFGIPVVEAMAAGTPVITSDSGALAEVAGEAAMLVDPRSVQQIASAMSTLLDPKHREALAAKGRERAKHFSWDDSARQTYTVLHKYGVGA